jgi:poly(hydroxyalkanoate) depolymerase family esterase
MKTVFSRLFNPPVESHNAVARDGGHMRRDACISAVMLLLLTVPGDVVGGTQTTYKGTVNNLPREWIFFVPDNLPASPPLVFFLQGCCSDYSTWPGQTGYNTLADTAKTIVCYPAAINTQGQLNNRDWDVTTDRDLLFILALLDTAVKKFNINTNRVYATGHSMGGYMSNYLACNYPDKIAAIAPVAGCNLTITNLTNPQRDRTDCKKSRPVSVFHMHGTADAGISYANGLRSVASWVKLNGCPSTALVTEKYKGAAKAKLEVYGPCEGNAEVDMLSIDGLAHVWLTKGNSGVSGTEEGWNFMKRYSIVKTEISDAEGTHDARPPVVTARYTSGTIVLNNANSATAVRLVDVKGRTIGAWNNIAGQRSLSIRPLWAGIYLLTIEKRSGRVVLLMPIQ